MGTPSVAYGSIEYCTIHFSVYYRAWCIHEWAVVANKCRLTGLTFMCAARIGSVHNLLVKTLLLYFTAQTFYNKSQIMLELYPLFSSPCWMSLSSVHRGDLSYIRTYSLSWLNFSFKANLEGTFRVINTMIWIPNSIYNCFWFEVKTNRGGEALGKSKLNKHGYITSINIYDSQLSIVPSLLWQVNG